MTKALARLRRALTSYTPTDEGGIVATRTKRGIRITVINRRHGAATVHLDEKAVTKLKERLSWT